MERNDVLGLMAALAVNLFFWWATFQGACIMFPVSLIMLIFIIREAINIIRENRQERLINQSVQSKVRNTPEKIERAPQIETAPKIPDNDPLGIR
jgi:Co/Zn/Cd efflux system component